MATATDWSDVDNMAREAAGNHRRFQSFAWFDRPEDADNWTIVYTNNRDSRLLDESNAHEISKALAHFDDSGDLAYERHGHWACGWVEGYAIRVFRDDGTITDVFRAWCKLQEKLADYPLLNEEDYSRREYEATVESIRIAGRYLVTDDAPDAWAEEVYSWLSDHNQREVENRDDQGGYPSDNALRDALLVLGWLVRDYMPSCALRCRICGQLVGDWFDSESVEIPFHYPYLDLNGFATPADSSAPDACVGSGLLGVVEYVEA